MPAPLSPNHHARRRRFVLPGHWIHVSARTQQGRFAFENFDPQFKARAWGIVGLANARYGVLLAAFVLMGNHLHALVKGRTPRRISQWCQYVKAGLARLTHEFHGTRGTVWDGPFRHTNLLTDAAELACLRYICAHGVKEGLVAHPGAWPGPNCIDALLEGKEIVGQWLDRDAWRLALRKDPKARKFSFLRKIPVELTPLSVGSRSLKVWREVCREVIEAIISEHAQAALPAEYRGGRDFTHIPETVKTSRSICFDARTEGGGVNQALLEEARQARRLGVEASVLAYERMVAQGLAELPHGIQWPALIAEAVREPVAEGPFPGRAPPGKAVS